MHGVMRLIVTLDGEDVVDCEPVLGCTGAWKIAETARTSCTSPMLVLGLCSGMFNEAVTVNARKS